MMEVIIMSKVNSFIRNFMMLQKNELLLFGSKVHKVHTLDLKLNIEHWYF